MTRCRRPLGLVLALILLAAPLAWDRWWVPRAEAQLYQLGGTLQSAATATGNGSTLDTSLTSIVAYLRGAPAHSALTELTAPRRFNSASTTSVSTSSGGPYRAPPPVS